MHRLSGHKISMIFDVMANSISTSGKMDVITGCGSGEGISDQELRFIGRCRCLDKQLSLISASSVQLDRVTNMSLLAVRFETMNSFLN